MELTREEEQVLFFEDLEAADRMPPMLGNMIKGFPEWGDHSNGMNQYIGMLLTHFFVPSRSLATHLEC